MHTVSYRNGVNFITMPVETEHNYDEKNNFRFLDRGIDDMESVRELPLDDAFKKICELREVRKNARL